MNDDDKNVKDLRDGAHQKMMQLAAHHHLGSRQNA